MRGSTMKTKTKLLLLLGIISVIFAISFNRIIAPMTSKFRKTVISSAQKKNLAQTVTLEGVVEPIDKQIIEINSTSKVLDIFVEEGQEIKKGGLLLKFDTLEDQH